MNIAVFIFLPQGDPIGALIGYAIGVLIVVSVFTRMWWVVRRERKAVERREKEYKMP